MKSKSKNSTYHSMEEVDKKFTPAGFEESKTKERGQPPPQTGTGIAIKLLSQIRKTK